MSKIEVEVLEASVPTWMTPLLREINARHRRSTVLQVLFADPVHAAAAGVADEAISLAADERCQALGLDSTTGGPPLLLIMAYSMLMRARGYDVGAAIKLFVRGLRSIDLWSEFEANDLPFTEAGSGRAQEIDAEMERAGQEAIEAKRAQDREDRGKVVNRVRETREALLAALAAAKTPEGERN